MRTSCNYDPKDVTTLAGRDYMDYYNERAEAWKKARDKVKKSKHVKNRVFREVSEKMEKGDISYAELRGVGEYRELLLDPKLKKKLEDKSKCVRELAQQDYWALKEKIDNKEVTSLDEVVASGEWKLAYKYYKDEIESSLRLCCRN